jgi:hypothetical protein
VPEQDSDRYGTWDDSPSKRVLAHDSDLRKLLAYVAGSFAGFLPLIDYAINSQRAPSGLLWDLFWIVFVVVGSFVTVSLPGLLWQTCTQWSHKKGSWGLNGVIGPGLTPVRISFASEGSGGIDRAKTGV